MIQYSIHSQQSKHSKPVDAQVLQLENSFWEDEVHTDNDTWSI